MNLQSTSQPLTSGGPPLHRCFYAVRFNEETTSYLASIIAELRRHGASVRWVPERNIHLTLRFLGEITDAQLEASCRWIGEAARFDGFSLRASGLGAFPLLRAPRVLWAGVDGETRSDLDRLLHLQSRTEEWARRVGLPPERRTYAPHITLGRVVRPLDHLKEVIDDIIGRECRSALSRVGEVVLMRSERDGYETIAREVLMKAKG